MIIALGSNENPTHHMEQAVAKLIGLFASEVSFSGQLWTEPISIKSKPFLNMLALAHTGHSLTQISKALRYIERAVGGSREEHKHCIVRIDIDVLQYGEQRYHEADWERDYVKELLCDLEHTTEGDPA